MNMNDSMKDQGTRERILQAAGEAFAENGFRFTTVRDISQKAEANLAAINYYFGNKEKLYFEVLKYTLETAMKKFPNDSVLDPKISKEEKLQSFIRSFIMRILDETHPSWFGKLFAMEMADPTDALDLIIEQGFQPLHNKLASIISEFLNKDVDDRETRLCVLSVIGQCILYRHCNYMLKKLYPKIFTSPEIDLLVNHITEFTLGALKEYGKKKTI
jgi:TetR/AcrR family transcriptional regulator, regulator of cefoperazone and chloramphenicol sensitivity